MRRVTHAGMAVLLVCLMLACGDPGPPQGPVYSDVPAQGVVWQSLRLAVHPLHNPQKLLQAYGPLADYLNARLDGVRIEIEASNSYAHFETKYRAGEPDLILPNPYQTIQALGQGYRVIAEAGDSEDFRGLFIVRRDAGIHQPADLRGLLLAYPSPTALAAAMMPKLWLARQGVDLQDEVGHRYVGSQESAILSVYRGEAAVGVTWPPPWRAFQASHPEAASELTPLWMTEPLINNSVMVSPRVSPALAAQLQALLLDMHAHPDGQAALAGMQTERFHPADDERYRQVVGAFLADYMMRVGALP